MRYFEIFEYNSNNHANSMWHSMDAMRAVEHLRNDFIPAVTSQRYWPNGQRLKDNHRDYDDSFWMFGISTTRSPVYAADWKSVVFELDRNLIKQKYKITPINWGYTSHVNNNHKVETEEFIALNYKPKTHQQMKDEWEEYEGDEYKNFNDVWTSPGKGYSKLENLNKYLKAIYIPLINFNWRLEREEMISIMKHPKYKGIAVTDKMLKKFSVEKAKKYQERLTPNIDDLPISYRV